MKKTHKIAIYVLSVPTIFLSIILLCVGQAGGAVALMGGLAFIAYMIYHTSKMQANKLTEANYSAKIDISEISQFDIKSLQRRGLQMLETIYLIETTKNLSTLSGNVDFITHHYSWFMKMSGVLSRYENDIQAAVDEYLLRYYDRQITVRQKVLMFTPDNERLNEFLSLSICRCFTEYAARQADEMVNLKTEAAKQRRKADILDKADIALKLYGTFGIPEEGNVEIIKELIEDVRSA